jgi:ribosomal protein L32E
MIRGNICVSGVNRQSPSAVFLLHTAERFVHVEQNWRRTRGNGTHQATVREVWGDRIGF